MKLPKISENLLVQDLNDEVLVYDLKTNKSYCLNQTAKTVFNACDGKKTFADLNLPDEIIHLTLDDLKKQNLIESGYASPLAGMNRREVIRKVGVSTMIALPIISSLVAPQSSNAASGSNANCVPLNTCRAAGTVFCPPGCTGTYDFTSYNSTNGTCTGFLSTDSIDCASDQGTLSVVDYRRVS